MVDSTGMVGVAVIVLALLIVFWLSQRSAVVRDRAGMLQALLGLVAVPVLVSAIGTRVHLQKAKSTDFCLSCHEMEPYGRTLHADAEWLPAVHLQNRRIPSDKACYVCHTSYTMFGDLEAKMKGVRHLAVHYFGEIPETIELYEPYRNRECLHCHGGARYLLEDGMHDELLLAEDVEEVSCLECHDTVHELDELEDTPSWEAPDA